MRRVLHPARAWRRASTRTRVRLVGQAMFGAALLAGRAGLIATPIALVVFAVGAAVTAAVVLTGSRS